MRKMLMNSVFWNTGEPSGGNPPNVETPPNGENPPNEPPNEEIKEWQKDFQTLTETLATISTRLETAEQALAAKPQSDPLQTKVDELTAALETAQAELTALKAAPPRKTQTKPQKRPGVGGDAPKVPGQDPSQAQPKPELRHREPRRKLERF